MSDMTIKEVAEAMRDIDYCMLSTLTGSGAIATRPMSNNRDVEYDGESRFFSSDEQGMVSEIAASPDVGLSYQGKAGLFGKPPLFMAANGKAEIVRDKAAFAEHWVPALDDWFPDGIDSPGLVMIKVKTERMSYWNGMDHGEILL